jgi:hypothetical protein
MVVSGTEDCLLSVIASEQVRPGGSFRSSDWIKISKDWGAGIESIKYVQPFVNLQLEVVSYKDWGNKSDPVVTFSHGWPLNSDNWEKPRCFSFKQRLPHDCS